MDDLRSCERPVVVERIATPRGELVLRRAGPHYEIISNGVFLMDTRGGDSERLLVRAPLDRLGRPASMLICGLGVGFSLAEAVADARVTRIDVIECEPAVIGWHAGSLAGRTGGALADPRVKVINTDLLEWLRTAAAGRGAAPVPPAATYDIACVDIDNGPDWTVTEANAALYDAAGLDLLARRLSRGGLLAVWSAHPSPGFEARLRTRFTGVETRHVAVARGAPDVVYLAAAAR